MQQIAWSLPRRMMIPAIVAALILAGCGGSSDDNGGEAAASATATPAATAPAVPTATPDPTATPIPTATPVPTPTAVPVEPVAINQIQVIGSHNSYHLRPVDALFGAIAGISPELAENIEYSHRSLTDQLELYGVRQFELDVFADPDGGLYAAPAANPLVGLPALDDPAMLEPGFKVLHQQDFDYATTCSTLVACLDEIEAWSLANPEHLPIMIMIEFKSESVPDAAADEGLDIGDLLPWTVPIQPTSELLDALDAEIRSVFDADQLIEPDDVRGDAATLEEAVLTTGWPSVDESRGRVLFTMTHGDTIRDLYVQEAPSLEGRPMFTNGTPGNPDAAFIRFDDPADPGLAPAVEAGYLVRTRTDSPTADARANDGTRRDLALASGAHFLSTDYYAPSEFFDSPYVVELPGDVVARCNPVNAPVSCDAGLLSN